MVIINLLLKPFGALKNTELNFKHGLNIILGSNEAGKTTIFHAIQNVLFTGVNLTQTKFQAKIKRFVPIGGGDTIHVEIGLLDQDDTYLLWRTWGAKKAQELTLPDGSVISDENRISEKLESLLHAKEGTYRSILMSYQQGLSRTLEELKSNYKETVQSLGDILRKSILETDGVSIDRFKEMIEQRYEEYANHWDFSNNYPVKGKRYKKQVGKILDAFYKKEDIRSKYRDALDYEEELDQLNKDISKLTIEIDENKRYIEQNREIVDAARERKSLDKDIELLDRDIRELKEANINWPIYENTIKELKKSIPVLEKKENELKDEKVEAEIEEKNKKLRERHKEVSNKKLALDEAQIKLNKIRRLTRDELEIIQKSCEKLNTLKTRLEAGKLGLELMAKRDLSFLIQKDSETELKEEVKRDKSLKIEAGARIKLENQDLIMEILSGRGDINEIIINFEETEREVQALFTKYGIDSYEKAKEINRAYEKELQNVQTLKKSFDDELGDDNLEELVSKANEIGPEKKTRPLSDILKDLANIDAEINSLKEKQSSLQESIKSFESSYKSHDELLKRLTYSIEQKNKVTEKLKSLPRLPEGIEDADTFISQYEGIKKELDELKDKEKYLLLKRARVESEAPALSSEEYEKELQDSEERFNSVLQRGEAISRIRDLSHRIMKELDSGTYKGIEKKLENYIAIITNKRYEHVMMEESLPQGFIRDDGKTVPYELLSTGTRDVLALALRLSMAEYFLEGTDGFLMMDDPLVNLDPDRQKKAAEVIRDFSKRKQLLLFTCQPSHAEILGDAVINV